MFAAVDLGAESGRVVLGRFDGAAMSLEVVHRFANRPVWLPDGLHWNLLGLFADTLDGLRARRGAGPAATASASTLGASTTRCSTARRRMLGLPFHYRDGAHPTG